MVINKVLGKLKKETGQAMILIFSNFVQFFKAVDYNVKY